MSHSYTKQSLSLGTLVCPIDIITGPISVWAVNHFINPAGTEIAPRANAAPRQTITFARTQAANNDKIKLSAGVFQQNSLFTPK